MLDSFLLMPFFALQGDTPQEAHEDLLTDHSFAARVYCPHDLLKEDRGSSDGQKTSMFVGKEWDSVLSTQK